MYTSNYQYSSPSSYDDRIIGGGFIAPFLLGGLTGAVLSPYFYPRPYYYPQYYSYSPYYYPYPSGPYYYR